MEVVELFVVEVDVLLVVDVARVVLTTSPEDTTTIFTGMHGFVGSNAKRN